VLDLPGFSRFDVRGPARASGSWAGSRAAAETRPHRLAYFPDARGPHRHRDVGDATDEDHFMLITAATAQWHDREWLARHARGLTLTDRTRDFSTLIVTGPAIARPFTGSGPRPT
jgi:dimethylglycine dehydrogenase